MEVLLAPAKFKYTNNKNNLGKLISFDKSIFTREIVIGAKHYYYYYTSNQRLDEDQCKAEIYRASKQIRVKLG